MVTRDTAGPPWSERAAGTTLTSKITHRARRAAALRLPPHGDGPVDPLDDVIGQPIRGPQRCHGAEYTAAGWRSCCRGAA